MPSDKALLSATGVPPEMLAVKGYIALHSEPEKHLPEFPQHVEPI